MCLRVMKISEETIKNLNVNAPRIEPHKTAVWGGNVSTKPLSPIQANINRIPYGVRANERLKTVCRTVGFLSFELTLELLGLLK